MTYNVFGGTLNLALSISKYTQKCICSRALVATHIGVFRAQGTYLLAANIVSFLLNKLKN